MILKDFKIFLIIFLIGSLSLVNNTLNIASPSWYQIYGWDSEQLVLDGILNSDKKNILKSSFLGEYTRPNNERGALFSRKYFKEKNKEGVFNRYTSQYGLQVKIFSFLNSFGIPINWLRTLNSFLLSIILSSSYLILRKSNYNILGSISFTLAFLLSPWIIVSSPNLYWVTFTWYLPTFINSILISSNLIYKRIYLYLLFFLVFFAFLIKFLCGFEYITSILLFTIISTIFIGIKRNLKRNILKNNIFTVIFAFLLAFLLAISLTILNLNKGGYDGFQLFKFTVQKRVSFKDPNTVFSTYCKSEKNKDSFKFCMESLKDTEDTLKANRFLVTTKYFFIKEFLPWFHSDFSELTSNDKSLIKKNFKKKFFDINIFSGFHLLSKYLKIFLFRLLNLISLPIIIFSIILFSKKKKSSLIILSLASTVPLSWYLIANGHSASHLHLNYTLMYMGFIPIVFYLFANNIHEKFFEKRTKPNNILNKLLQG